MSLTGHLELELVIWSSPGLNVRHFLNLHLLGELSKNHADKVCEEVEAPSPHILPIKSFRQFVELFYQKREGMIHTYLYNNVKLVSFKEGEVVINAKIIENPHFTRTIAKLIAEYFGKPLKIKLKENRIRPKNSEVNRLLSNNKKAMSLLEAL